jgi:hypothetical protein
MTWELIEVVAGADVSAAVIAAVGAAAGAIVVGAGEVVLAAVITAVGAVVLAVVITAVVVNTGVPAAVITAVGPGAVGLGAAAGAVVVGAGDVVLAAVITVVVVATGVLPVAIDAVRVSDVAGAGVGLLTGTDCTTITDATESESVSDAGSGVVGVPDSKSRASSVSNGARTPRGSRVSEGIPRRLPALLPTRSRSSPTRHHLRTSLPASPSDVASSSTSRDAQAWMHRGFPNPSVRDTEDPLLCQFEITRHDATRNIGQSLRELYCMESGRYLRRLDRLSVSGRHSPEVARHRRSDLGQTRLDSRDAASSTIWVDLRPVAGPGGRCG